MTEFSAQGSITVRRLRTGGSLYLTMENNGIPLYQGIDPMGDKVPIPDWTIPENQPMLTPHAISTRGNKVVLQKHRWSYNGTPLQFSEGADWVKSTDGKFSMNVTTGALKIIDNLASKTNIANDTLTYECQAVVSGIEYHLTKSVDIAIQNIGASSYWGTLMATNSTLTEETPTSKLTTQLYLSAVPVPEYYVKWYKDDTVWTEKNGQKTITVGKADVKGSQLFIAEFYKSSDEPTPVFRAGVRIIDEKAEFVVICSITSVNKEVEENIPVTVSAKLLNTEKNTVIEPLHAVWRMDVVDRKTWEVLKTAPTNTIEVTTAETDRNGEENDVEVLGEVTWN